jgi:two-component system KDP operon response regulator KdpE
MSTVPTTVDERGARSAASAAAAHGALLLLVEDDEGTRAAAAANLAAHGYGVTEASSVAEAMRRWEALRPDLILLDLGLPDRDGISVVRRVRAEATTPILVISARNAEREKVAALEAGADDYVTKPFGMAELRARIAALLRRAAGPAADAAGIISLGPVSMDLTQREVSVSGTPVELTPREYELLKVMLSQPGRVLTRGRLLRAVWGTSYDQEAHYLHVYVSRLRRKLLAADPSGDAAALIVAEPGVGYRIVADLLP